MRISYSIILNSLNTFSYNPIIRRASRFLLWNDAPSCAIVLRILCASHASSIELKSALSTCFNLSAIVSPLYPFKSSNSFSMMSASSMASASAVRNRNSPVPVSCSSADACAGYLLRQRDAPHSGISCAQDASLPDANDAVYNAYRQNKTDGHGNRHERVPPLNKRAEFLLRRRAL